MASLLAFARRMAGKLERHGPTVETLAGKAACKLLREGRATEFFAAAAGLGFSRHYP